MILIIMMMIIIMTYKFYIGQYFTNRKYACALIDWIDIHAEKNDNNNNDNKNKIYFSYIFV